jgi:glycerol-3-phosphate dehydrogenase (NAD(P)+)
MSERIAVLGAGSWGTALANLLAGKGHDVTVWSYERDVADAINANHENPRYLSGIPLAPTLRADAELERAVRAAPVIVSVSPAQHVRRVLAQAAPAMPADALLVSASKGIEMKSLRTMAQVATEVLPKPVAASACYISGPSFALEVARGLATAVTIASHDAEAAARAQQLFQTSFFRVYTSEDVTGVELGGSLKNVIAIAAGMLEGLGLGNNPRAALITRGLAEITRLGVAMGADPRTFAGLAGVGDLVLTTCGNLSRNRALGVALGQGSTVAEFQAGHRSVVEGVDTARAAVRMAERAGVEMPIAAKVAECLFEAKPVRRAILELMERTLKPELWT